MSALAFLIIATLVLVDQITKIMAVDFIKPIGEMEIIKNFFSFAYVENRGAAFGILQNQRWIFIVATIVILTAFIYFLIKYEIKSKLLFTSIVLVISGGIGNMIDRIFLGYVVDFIYFDFFPPVFNFADCCVTVGALALLPPAIILCKEPAVRKTR